MAEEEPLGRAVACMCELPCVPREVSCYTVYKAKYGLSMVLGF